MVAIVESAAIYSAASVALVVTFFVSENAGYRACLNTFTVLIVSSIDTMIDNVAHIRVYQGFVFSFIVIRVGLRIQPPRARHIDMDRNIVWLFQSKTSEDIMLPAPVFSVNGLYDPAHTPERVKLLVAAYTPGRMNRE